MILKTLILVGLISLIISCRQNKSDSFDKNETTNIKSDNDSSLLRTNADLLYKGDNFQDALLEYEKLARIDSLNGQFEFRIGYCLAQLNRHAESVDHYLKSAELNFKRYDSYYSVGLLYYTLLNNDKKALTYFKKCLEINPNAKDVQDMINKLNGRNAQTNT